MERLDDRTVTQVASTERRALPRDLCLSMRGNYGISEWVDIIKMRSSATGFDVTTIHDEDEDIFVIRHYMGEKYSLHLKSFYE
ncbi:MAG: hypothetical protein KGH88_06250 [Thaumarchaeota archaeon]|nr:hypothetical protein [Nitrososphaerota archaeon]